MTVTDSVRDVAFAPNLGRSYHMLAIASKDVTVITLKPLTRWVPVACGSRTRTGKMKCRHIINIFLHFP